MSISRAKPAGWGIGDKLTSAEQNQVDTNTTYALDKRSGQTDTLESVVSCSGAGRLIDTYAAGADADTTYLVSGANAIIDVATLTADRVYTLSNTNAVAGDRITILNRSSFYVTVKNAAATTLVTLGDAISSGESGWAEVLYTGSVWVLFRSAVPSKNNTEWTFTASATNGFTAPRGVYRLLLIGCGAGGGGGAAPAGNTSDNNYNTGGGGGGGARIRTAIVAVTPLSSYDVTIGIGGPGGNADHGGDGGDTIFREGGGGTVLATFVGASGGKYKSSVSTSATTAYYTKGGHPSRLRGRLLQVGSSSNSDTFISYTYSSSQPTIYLDSDEGHGGFGVDALGTVNGAAYNGTSNGYVTTFFGGTKGSTNSADGSKQSGGAGGGGGAGPFGAGGNGGAGGTANNSGAAGNGGVGINAGANTGAGGGGAGAGGFGTSAGGAGLGGNGGSGKLIIVALR